MPYTMKKQLLTAFLMLTVFSVMAQTTRKIEENVFLTRPLREPSLYGTKKENRLPLCFTPTTSVRM